MDLAGDAFVGQELGDWLRHRHEAVDLAVQDQYGDGRVLLDQDGLVLIPIPQAGPRCADDGDERGGRGAVE